MAKKKKPRPPPPPPTTITTETTPDAMSLLGKTSSKKKAPPPETDSSSKEANPPGKSTFQKLSDATMTAYQRVFAKTTVKESSPATEAATTAASSLTTTNQAQTLTQRMRAATRKSHKISDTLVNLKLSFVLASPPLYGEAIALFFPIYAKLEAIIDRSAKHPHLGKLVPIVEEMRRAPLFREDILYYVHSDRQKELESMWENSEPAAVGEYLEHLDFLEERDPVRILAYVYHLYAAILAGGQILKRTVRSAMGLKKGDSTGVKIFLIPSSGILKKLRQILNEEITLSKLEAERVVEEGNEVFRLNNKLVQTIHETPAWKLSVQSIYSALGFGVSFAISFAVVFGIWWQFFSSLR